MLSFLRILVDEFARLDFKSVRSLAALFVPGRLTALYVAGRREPFLNPLKTYLLAAALFFLVAPYVFGFSLEQMLQDDANGRGRELVQARLSDTQQTFEVFAARFVGRLRLLYTLSLGLSVLVIASLLRVLYGRVFPAMTTHVVFALHYVAFFYVATLVVNALNHALNRPDAWILFGVQYAILAPYAFLSLRRVYGGGAGVTALKCAAMLAGALLFSIVVEVGTMRLTIALT